MSPLVALIIHVLAPSLPRGPIPILILVGVAALAGFLLGRAGARRAQDQDEALRAALAAERQLGHEERRLRETEAARLREAAARAEARADDAERARDEVDRQRREGDEALRQAEAALARAEAARAQAEEAARAQAALVQRQAAELATRPPAAQRAVPALAVTPAPDGEAAPAPAGLRGVRALCAVGDEGSLGRLTALLSRWGLKARGARDGYQGLELLREARAAGSPFQVVILDAEVPGLDGASLGRLIREDGAIGEVPLLLLLPEGAVAEEGVFAAMLRKPVAPAELAARLQELLRPAAS